MRKGKANGHDTTLRKDVEELLELSVVSEALRRVQQYWDEAMAALDPQSRNLLNEYFDGRTVEEISVRHNLSVDETEKWVARSKRQLNQVLRTRIPVKQ